MQNVQITIDGPAASGKSTIARLVAERLDGFYINTGDMYRTLTWVIRECGFDPKIDTAAIVALLDEINIRYEISPNGVPQLLLNGEPVQQTDIRNPKVAAEVSDVAKIREVRTWMVQRQRLTARLGLVVMEGRDIGTVVFPEAAHKFFLTASPAERARRRLNQAGESPCDATVESVAAEIARRDRIDSTRAVAPLRPARDAVTIDSTHMTQEEVATQIINTILSTETNHNYA